MLTSEPRYDGGNCTEMVRLDRFVTKAEKQDIVKEFVGTMSD